MDALSKRLDQAPVFGEDTDVIYLHSCDLKTQFDFKITVPSLQFSRLNVVLRPIHFCQFFGGEALKLKLICYQLTGEFWRIDSTGVRFLFIVQVIEKVQKKAQFSFCRQMKAFHYEIVLRGIHLSFLHGGALGLL